MATKEWYRIYDTKNKKYVRLDNGQWAVFEYPIQAVKYIENRLDNSTVFEVRKWEK